MFNHILNIWIKEVLDSVRDKRGLRQALLVPVFLGIGYAVLNPLLASAGRERAQQPLEIPTVGLENATVEFTEFLAQFEITLFEYEGDLAADIEKGDLGAGMIIPDDFGDSLENEAPISLTILVNPTSGGLFGAGFSTSRLELALNSFSNAVATGRLAQRDLDPSLLAPVSLDVQDLSTDAQRGGIFAALMLPILVGVVAAQGGMFIAIDVTAGEKERGTLEALLVTPATDVEIFVGKLMAVFTMTSVPLILTFLAFWLGSNLLPESITEGAVLPLGVIIRTILVTLPLALFINTVLMIVAVRAKTFKDAQSAATPAIFGVLIPSMAAAFIPPTVTPMFAIPIYGTAATVAAFAVGGTIPAGAVLYSVMGSLLAAGVAILIALRLFNRERLLYSA